MCMARGEGASGNKGGRKHTDTHLHIHLRVTHAILAARTVLLLHLLPQPLVLWTVHAWDMLTCGGHSLLDGEVVGVLLLRLLLLLGLHCHKVVTGRELR
jgi:hypothetical protein